MWFNDNNAFCCSVLRRNFPGAIVDERPIESVQPDDVVRQRECHFFAGIGGFALGLAWAGWGRAIWTGGFPCQGISAAGRRKGLDDERSGLWWEWFRLIEACRPPRLLIENSPGLKTRGADAVLSSLERIGYTCWPFVVGAASVGSSQERKRVWIVAVDPEQLGPCGSYESQWESQKRIAARWPNPGGSPAWFGEQQDEREPGWLAEPGLAAVADGVPAELAVAHRKAKLAAIGNSLDPRVVQEVATAWAMAEEEIWGG